MEAAKSAGLEIGSAGARGSSWTGSVSTSSGSTLRTRKRTRPDIVQGGSVGVVNVACIHGVTSPSATVARTPPSSTVTGPSGRTRSKTSGTERRGWPPDASRRVRSNGPSRYVRNVVALGPPSSWMLCPLKTVYSRVSPRPLR